MILVLNKPITMRTYIFIGLFLLLYGVASVSNTSVVAKGKKGYATLPFQKVYVGVESSMEHFQERTVLEDSVSFGANKVVVKDVYNEKGHCAEVSVFQSRNGSWELASRIEIESETEYALRPQIGDFNNDWHNDLTLQVAEAARGSNELRKLLLFDPENATFIPVQGSENHPNLQYNKKLNCLDSWAFFSGTATRFLRIQGDSLVKFAQVEDYEDVQYVYVRNEQGEMVLIAENKLNSPGTFNRYINYDPVEPY